MSGGEGHQRLHGSGYGTEFAAELARLGGRGSTTELTALYLQAEAAKQSPKTLLHIFGRYVEGYMTLFDAI